MLSATASTSRANDAMPYWRMSETSRSVRLRRFSISASVRSSRSLFSAFSFASVSTRAAIFASSVCEVPTSAGPAS